MTETEANRSIPKDERFLAGPTRMGGEEGAGRTGRSRFWLAPAVCTLAASLLLAAGFLQAEHRPGALAVLAVGGLWLAAQLTAPLFPWVGRERVVDLSMWRAALPDRTRSWLSALCFVSLTGAAAAAMWQGQPAGWPLVGMVAALSAWDLEEFGRWLAGLQQAERARALALRHGLRLLLVDGGGALLAVLALRLQMRLPLGWLILFGLIASLALNRAILWLARESA